MLNIGHFVEYNNLFTIQNEQSGADATRSELIKLLDKKVSHLALRTPKQFNLFDYLTEVYINREVRLGVVFFTQDFNEINNENSEEIEVMQSLLDNEDPGILVIGNAQELFIYPKFHSLLHDYIENGLSIIFVHQEQTIH